jgi:hypothetical protein
VAGWCRGGRARSRRTVPGRQRRSAARWILVLSPPRERPSASRPGRAAGFLSFGAAPCEQVRGQGAAGPGGVLVRADHGGIGTDRPVLPLGLITAGPQPVQDLLLGPVPRTSGDAGYRWSSSSRIPRERPARGTRSGSGRRSRRSPSGGSATGRSAADRRAGSPAAAPIPCQVMTIQSIRHCTDLHQSGAKIHGTTP